MLFATFHAARKLLSGPEQNRTETVQNRTGDGTKVESDGSSLAGGLSVAKASGEAAPGVGVAADGP